MRKGQNPAKFVNSVAKPERITVALLNYIPFLSGYYAEALEVLKLSISSMRADAGVSFDLMIFDNGSCGEVRDFLIDQKELGNLQYLVLSEKNLGKGGAWNIMLAGAPGEIISYTDSDVLFSPGWLKASVELLEAFPRTGMVTARPFRTNPEYHSKTRAWALKNANLNEGCFIPWDVFWEFNRSLGQDEHENQMTYSETSDWLIEYNGLKAFAGASHWQFTAYKEVLSRFLPFDMDRPMGQVKQLDLRMNDQNFLRLMTVEPLVMNLSNTLEGINLASASAPVKKKRNFFLSVPIIKKALLFVYDQIFKWYYA